MKFLFSIALMLSVGAYASSSSRMSSAKARSYDRASDLRTATSRADGSSAAEPREPQEEQDRTITSGTTEQRYNAHEDTDMPMKKKKTKGKKK